LRKPTLPNGLFHVLPGGPETGAALVKEPLVDMISFTGSTRVGRQVASIASEQLKRVSLELGGNNPYIVLDDANIEAAASAGAWGAFFHQGQICLTAGRHLVHERVAEAYAEALVRKAEIPSTRRYRSGRSSTSVRPPMLSGSSPRQSQRVRKC
jgi:benzaldehyde dehydrogenase (NAD)